MNHSHRALIALGRALKQAGYAFITVTPETHRHVEARAAAAGRAQARTLRDVFGWSRPFEPALLPAEMLALARAAEVLEQEGSLYRSKVRFSSLGDHLFVHSAYPTDAADAVFFGPDTYRYCQLVADECRGRRRMARAVDVGCGCGAGGILAAGAADSIVLADVSEAALAFAAVNAELAGVQQPVEVIASDVLAGVAGPLHLVLANPPYMIDPASRAYRDGGGHLGEALALRILRESIDKLEPQGRLILYTGAVIVDGVDAFFQTVDEICSEANVQWRYREIDPDVFGEEILRNDAYAEAERIAAISLVVDV